MSTYFNYGFGNAKNLLEKVKRDRNSLHEAINTQEEKAIADSVFNFSVTAYHIKDWLKAEGVHRVEDYVNNNQELMICADLCNGSKHKLLNKSRDPNEPVSSVFNSPLTADMTTINASSTIPIIGSTVRIELVSGKQIEILDFSNKVVSLWDAFFKTHRI